MMQASRAAPDLIPRPLVDASVVRTLGHGAITEAMRSVLRLAGREVLTSVDLFVKLTLSVFAVRMVSKLMSESRWFSRELWEASPQLVQGFEPTRAAPASQEKPELLFEHDDEKYYRHSRMYEGQVFPCPILLVEPCNTCKWFVRGGDGKSHCAAVAKVASRYHDRFRDMNLYDMRDVLQQTYQQPEATDTATH